MRLDLCAALEDLAGELAGVQVVTVAAVVEYRRAGTPFASCGAGVAAFRLRPEIAAAAVKTPDTSASPRGPEWVTLRPSSLDTYALDRALAWFQTAWRIAGEKPERLAAPH